KREVGGIQLMPQVVHARGDRGGSIGCLARTSHDAGLGVTKRLAQLVELDREQSPLLAHIVMELARDAHALHFLCSDQARRKVAYPHVAPAELRLTAAHTFLGSSSLT